MLYPQPSLSPDSKFMSLVKSIRNDFSSGKLWFRYCCNYYWPFRKPFSTRLRL